MLGFHPTTGNLLMEGNWAAQKMGLPGPNRGSLHPAASKAAGCDLCKEQAQR